MKVTRRGLVSSGVAALVGTAGCLGGGSNVRYPADARPPAAEEGEPFVGASSTAAAEDADTAPAERTVPNAALARRTRRVVEELAWFGSEYDEAIAAYRAALKTAEDATREVRAGDAVGEADLDRLRSVTVQARSVAERELGGHFAVAGVIDDIGSNYLDVIAKFAARDDRDRVDQELQRLADFFNGLRSRPYVDANLSSNPVQNRLLARLRDGPASTDEPRLFAVYHGPTEFRSLAYAGDHRNFYRDVSGDSMGVVEAPFAGLQTPERRRGVTVVRTYEMPKRSDWPAVVDRNRYADDLIHVQEYADAPTASETLASLLDGDVTQEGSRTLGDHEWRRVYYDHRGDVMYAFVLQAGEFLVTVSPDEIAWEERTTWQEPLRRSWVV